jgi:hypothetical protein
MVLKKETAMAVPFSASEPRPARSVTGRPGAPGAHRVASGWAPHQAACYGGAMVTSFRARLEAGRFTLFPDPLSWVRFDLAGRWTAALLGGTTYRRSLGGEVIAIAAERQGEERFHAVRRLALEESEGLSEKVHAFAAAATAEGAAERARVERVPPGVSAETVLRSAAALDAAALADSAARFHRIYQGHPIVPPDRTEDVMIQSTIGCAHNRCSFCVFYRDLRHGIRSRAALEKHLDEVASFLGPALSARRGVFVGDASALTANFETVCGHLETIRERMVPRMMAERNACMYGPALTHVEPLGAFRMFCDAFLRPLRTEEELARLRDLGLYRVYLGVESGCDALLAFLGKPATAASIATLVERLERVGIAVSLIIMTGVGGRSFAQEHVAQTAALLNRLPLQRRDSIVFSEFFVMDGSSYAADAALAGIEPFSRPECRQQAHAIRDLLRFPADRTPHRQMYDARQLLV